MLRAVRGPGLARARRDATPTASSPSIVQPHMFMSPMNTPAGRSAAGSRRRARVCSGDPNSRWLKWVADHGEVRCRRRRSRLAAGHRDHGIEAELGEVDRRGWLRIGLAGTAGPGTSRRRPCAGPDRLGPRCFGRGSSTARAIGTDDHLACRARRPPRRAASGPPSGAHDSCSTITSASKRATGLHEVEGRPAVAPGAAAPVHVEARRSSARAPSSALRPERLDARGQLGQRRRARGSRAAQGRGRRARAPTSPSTARGRPDRRWRARGARRCAPSCRPSRTWPGSMPWRSRMRW